MAASVSLRPWRATSNICAPLTSQAGRTPPLLALAAVPAHRAPARQLQVRTSSLHLAEQVLVVEFHLRFCEDAPRLALVRFVEEDIFR